MLFCRGGGSGLLICQCGHHLSSRSLGWVLIPSDIFCVASQRCWGKIHTSGAFHLDIYSIIILEARALKAICQQDHKFSSTSRKKFFASCSFWCPQIVSHWLFLEQSINLQLHLIMASLSSHVLSSLVSHKNIFSGFGIHPDNSGWFYSTLLT